MQNKTKLLQVLMPPVNSLRPEAIDGDIILVHIITCIMFVQIIKYRSTQRTFCNPPYTDVVLNHLLNPIMQIHVKLPILHNKL